MTKAEERRALLKEQSASMQRSTNVVNNKAQERRKMLGYAQTTPTPTVQSPINNAFNILNNANNIRNYDTAKRYGEGNIDLLNRPVVTNADGSISTVRSMSFEDKGKEILVPTVINGKVVSEDEAIEHYYNTGEYLGKFNSIKEADDYAQELHEQQEKIYSNQNKTTPISSTSNKIPTFKTLEEAQEYANDNNIKVNSPTKEQVQKIENLNKLNSDNIIKLNKEDKDFYLRNLNMYKNELELATNSYNSAKEEYKNAIGEEKDKALEKLKKVEEKYNEKKKDYDTALKYEEYFNPLGKHARNFTGSVSQGVANTGNYLTRSLEENKNSLTGNSYDNINAEALYNYIENPNDVKNKMQGVNSLMILQNKARTSENAKKLLDELINGKFEGDAVDLKKDIDNIKIQDYQTNKIMENTYKYVENNDAIANNMNMGNTEKAIYDAEKVVGNMLPTIGLVQ